MRHPILHVFWMTLMWLMIIVFALTSLLECITLIANLGMIGAGLIIALIIIVAVILLISHFVYRKVYDYKHK